MLQENFDVAVAFNLIEVNEANDNLPAPQTGTCNIGNKHFLYIKSCIKFCLNYFITGKDDVLWCEQRGHSLCNNPNSLYQYLPASRCSYDISTPLVMRKIVDT
jgi:hypothetical protein